jgi:hypothetical protein
MSKNTRIRAIALVGIIAAVLGAPGVYGQGTKSCVQTGAQILPIDTPESLRAVKPLPLPELSREAFERLLRRFIVMRHDSRDFVIPSGRAKTPDSPPGTPVQADVDENPFEDAGRLFTSAGACSAAFVGSSNVLLTAAHCVRNGKSGDWFWSFRFYRAYANGGGQGVSTTCICTWSDWPNQTGGDHAFDYAFIQTNQPSETGWLGIQSGIPYPEWTSVGYPADYGNGLYMYKVLGWKGTIQRNIVQMRGNPMGVGISGGPWIGHLTTSGTGGNYAIGVNSFRPIDEPNNVYGPYFDSSVTELYQYVANGCK